MVKKMNSFTSKLLAIIVTVALLMSIVPYAVISSFATGEDMGTITALVSGATVDGSNVEFENVNLNWVAKNDSQRSVDGWWVGINLTAPNSADIANAKYQNQIPSGWGEVKSFDVYKDTANSIQLWGLVNEQYINDAKAKKEQKIRYGYRFDWDGDGNYEQIIGVNIDANTVTLKKDGETVYPLNNYAEVKPYGDFLSIAGNKGNYTVAELNKVTELAWVEKNTNIGRNNDGWWVGVNVIAPEGTDASKVKFQSKNADGWGEAKSFDTYKDTANSIQVWGLVNESRLEDAVTKQTDLNHQWRFDWDGDGTFEQLVHIKLDPQKVVLNDKRGDQVYPVLKNPNLVFDKFVTETYLDKNGNNKYEVTVKSESSSKVVYSSSDNTVAEIDNNGIVTVKKVGVVTITAYMPDDGTYAAAEISKDLIIKKDETDPSDLKITFKDDKTVSNEKIVVAVEGKDGETGISKYYYKLRENDEYTEIGGNTFEIAPQYRGTVKVKAVDFAGNDIEATADGVVADSIAPEIKIDEKIVDGVTVEDKIYTSNEIVVEFTVEDSNVDLSGELKVKVNDKEITPDSWDNKTGKGTFKLTEEGEYNYSISFVDVAGNSKKVENEKLFIIDKTKPEVEVKFDVVKASANDKYFNVDRVATITVTEHYFDPAKVTALINGELKAITKWKSVGDVHTAQITFSEDAHYKFSVDCKDIAGNAAATCKTKDFVIDHNGPANLRIEYSKSVIDKVIETITFGFYKPNAVVTISADDEVAGVDYFEWQFVEQTGYGDNVATSTDEQPNIIIQATASDATATDATATDILDNIKYSGKTASATFVIPANVRGYITFVAVDKAGNRSKKFVDDKNVLVIDDIAPEVSVEYISNDGNIEFRDKDLHNVSNFLDAEYAYYQEDVTARITIKDENFFEGVTADDGIINNIKIKLTRTDDKGKKTVTEYLPEVLATSTEITNWTLDNGVYTFDIVYSKDGDYVLEVEYTDLSGNDAKVTNDNKEIVSKTYTSKTIVIDSVSPKIDVKYDSKVTAANEKYFKADRTATITVTEHNFDAEKVAALITAKDINGDDVTDDLIEIDSKKYVKSYYDYLKDEKNWSKGENNTYSAKIVFSSDAQYTFSLDCEDIAGNKADTYEAEDFVVDHKAPENFEITYSKSEIDKVIETITFGFYKPSVVVTITADDDISGVDYFEWQFVEQAGYGDNVATSTDEQPAIMTATDATLTDAVVTSILDNVSSSGKTTSTTFVIPANVRGYITVVAVDKAGNRSKKYHDEQNILVVDNIAPEVSILYARDDSDTKIKLADADFNIVDNIDETEYVYYNGSVTATITVDESNFFEGVVAEDGVINQVKVKLTQIDKNGNKKIIEYLPEGAVTGTNTDITETAIWKPVDGKPHKYTLTINYEDEGDYVLEIEYADLSKNEANFEDRINAKERDGFVKSYVSKTVVIDKTAPEINVEYNNNDPVFELEFDNEDSPREYYQDTRTATITIKERNFRPDDVVIKVKALDVMGNPISDFTNGTLTFDKENENFVIEYQEAGKDRSNWPQIKSVRTNDDVYTLTLEYANEANYTFDIEYADMATNKAEEYASDYFTVDRTAPERQSIAYSQHVGGKSVLEYIADALTFKPIYYNEQMKVTITAVDEISGVHSFKYSYTKDKNASDSNKAELLDEVIEEALENSPIVQNVNKDGSLSASFTASFNIPKEVLNENELGVDNQFNGKVSFTATDRAMNESEIMSGRQKVVVDDIEPVIKLNVTKPKNNKVNNNVWYYATEDDQIKATITVTEANFDSRYVKVTRQKDEGEFVKVKVGEWKEVEGKADTYRTTYSFPITGKNDGDYVIRVTYTDKSGNRAETQKSKKLVVDTKVPVIRVEAINGSANNGAANNGKVPFKVIITDVNVPEKGIEPEFTVVRKVKNASGDYTIEETPYSLGTPTKSDVNGETVFTYSLDNLVDDGYYSFKCKVTDFANNSNDKIICGASTGGEEEVEMVGLSANRKGSTFSIKTKHNDKNTGANYTNELKDANDYVNDKVEIKIYESNADELDTSDDVAHETILTINDGSTTKVVELVEGDNYEKNTKDKSDERSDNTPSWYKCVYTLDEDDFDHDGVYSINIITYDRADNVNVNNEESRENEQVISALTFTVDRTNPAISANVKSKRIIDASEYWVEFQITETNLNADKVEVELKDNNGNVVETKVEELGDNSYRFLVKEGLNYSFEIKATDLANNASDVYKVTNFTISTNWFVRFYANTAVFWLTISGIVLVIGAAIFFIILKKKKKREVEE